MYDAIYLAAATLATMPLSFVLGRRLGRAVPAPRCVGYAKNYSGGTFGSMQHNCFALRSAGCLDGRCTFHCGQMCKCSTPENAR